MTQDTKIIKLIAVYARVSTARQEEEKTIETQLLQVRDFAKKNGYTIVKEYIDEGWSGDRLDRPQLDQLRTDARNKIWEGVLVYDPSRLARRYSYQELVMDELREMGAGVIFVTTSAPQNQEEKILFGVTGLFAEYERAKISERFRIGKVRKVKEGNILLSEAPYGYNYIPKNNKVHGYLEINEQEAKIVKMMFAWVLDGVTIRGIIKKLQELAIQPRKSKRGVWSTSTLSTLLRNRTYIGEAHYGSTYATIPENPLKKEKYRKVRKTSKKMRPKEEWMFIKTPAILDIDLFTRVQDQLRKNVELSGRNNHKNQYLLSGKLRCSCGSTRAGESSYNGKNLYYRCADRIHRFPLPSTCTQGGINARIVDDLVWKNLLKTLSSPELLMKHIQRWVKNKGNISKNTGGDIEFIKKEISKLKEQEDRYNKAYGAGVFSLEQLREYLTQAQEKKSVLEKQLIKIYGEKNEISEAVLPKLNEIEILTKEAIKIPQNLNFEAKKVIIRNVIKNIVATQNELQVYGCILLNNYGTLRSIYRHRGAPKRR